MIELVGDEKKITFENLGPKLRHLRTFKDMTQTDLAAKACLSTASVHQAEQPEHNTTIYVLFALLDALGYELIIREKQ